LDPRPPHGLRRPWRSARLESDFPPFPSLLYGTGLRLTEALRLRIKDVDLIYDQITIRDGKEGKDRVTMLPVSVKPS